MRWSLHGKSETRIASEGDARFVSLDMTRDRALLQPGTLAFSQNKRLLNGAAATREGCVFESSFNPTNPGFTNQLVGSGIFSNPNGSEMLLVGELNANFVWALQYGQPPLQIPIVTGSVSGESGTLDCAQVHFVQAFDHVYALRRPSGTHCALIWDGTTSGGSANFTPVTAQAGVPTASVLIPGGASGTSRSLPTPWNGEPFAERILLYNDNYPTIDPTHQLPDRDTFIMTDTDRWDSYSQTQGVFRINSGESNILTRVLGYYRGAVLVFFKRGIHILENFTNPSVSIGDQRQINNFLGLINHEACVQVGVDVYFLSSTGEGVYRISEAVQDQIAVNPLAVSDPIQPIIDQIDWGQAQNWASMRTLGLYVYLGIPVNYGTTPLGTNGNNTIAVFNQYSREWESIDSFGDPAFAFNEMHVVLCGNVRRLITVDWYRKQIYGMYYGDITDKIGISGSDYQINDVIETRGYVLKDPNAFKRFQRTNIAVKTFDPEFEVTSISDGFNEEKLLTGTPVTKNRLRYYTHGHQFFDPAVDDPNSIRREDYAAGAFQNWAIEDFESLPVGPITTWPGQNLTVYNGELQQSLERFQIRQNGTWSSIRVDNNNGVCNVLAVSVDGSPIAEGIKTLA